MKIFCGIGSLLAGMLVIGVTAAQAENEHVGPFNLVAHVDGVEVPFAADGTLDINTAQGDFNANVDVTASTSTSALRDEVIAISEKILPVRVPTPQCLLRMTKLTSLAIASENNEADIDAVVSVSLERCALLSGDSDVPVKLAVIADATKPTLLRWKIVRTPTVGLPFSWSFLLRLAHRDLKTLLQDFLDAHASIKVPAVAGIRDAFQGANFDGNADKISLRIKGDAHTSGTDLTSLLMPVLHALVEPKLDFTVPAASE